MMKFEEIMQVNNIMNKIQYGFLDGSGNNIFDDLNVEFVFDKVYHLMSPEELLTKRVGVCWDQVELERKLFVEQDIENETYFIYIDNKENLPSHTFLVFYKNNKAYWYEHSWFDKQGIHEYNSLEDLINNVKNEFIKSRATEFETGDDIYIYKYNKPKYNISCGEFYNYIFSQKQVLKQKIK